MGSDFRCPGDGGFIKSASSPVMLMTPGLFGRNRSHGIFSLFFYFACFTLSLRFRFSLYVAENALNYSGHSDLAYIFSIIISCLLFYDIY